MDSQQARFLLQSWRANGADRDDPQFADALGQVERDPELAAWFEEEQTVDNGIRSKLREVQVPPGLRSQILAGHAAALSSATGSQGAQNNWRLLAMAALLAFLAVWAVFFRAPNVPSNDFVAYRSEMLRSINRGLALEFMDPVLSTVQSWLATNRKITNYKIPAGLQRLPSLGCRTWTWNGRPVGLICFSLGGNQAVHLFIVPRDAVPNAPPGLRPVFETDQGWMTANWTEGDTVYFVANKGDQAAVERLLKPDA